MRAGGDDRIGQGIGEEQVNRQCGRGDSVDRLVVPGFPLLRQGKQSQSKHHRGQTGLFIQRSKTGVCA